MKEGDYLVCFTSLKLVGGIGGMGFHQRYWTVGKKYPVRIKIGKYTNSYGVPDDFGSLCDIDFGYLCTESEYREKKLKRINLS